MRSRSFTAGLISKSKTTEKLGNERRNDLRRCLKAILDVIGPLFPREQNRDLAGELEEILFQAVRLSQTLRCQRALWSVRHVIPRASSNDLPVYFERPFMVNERGDAGDEGDRSRRRVVEVVVSPALFKCGNPDGEQYDVETCIEPAKVRSFLPADPTLTSGARDDQAGARIKH